MPRAPRLIVTSDESVVYHCMSRTALSGFPMEDVEKDCFMDLTRHLSKIYFAEIFGVTILDNHFHILCRIHPGGDTEIASSSILASFGSVSPEIQTLCDEPSLHPQNLLKAVVQNRMSIPQRGNHSG